MKKRSLLVFVVLAGTSAQLLAQGSLTPPGAPAPTLKTLQQVEPRADVQKLSGDATNLFIIGLPGAYYLSANVNGVSGRNGISVQEEETMQCRTLSGSTCSRAETCFSATFPPGNTTDFNIAGGNAHGPIIFAAGLGHLSGVAGANHPFANFRYQPNSHRMKTLFTSLALLAFNTVLASFSQGGGAGS
jgi:hypothetical protein